MGFWTRLVLGKEADGPDLNDELRELTEGKPKNQDQKKPKGGKGGKSDA